MVALAIVLTAYGAVVGVRVDEIGQVSVETAVHAATELARAIGQHTGAATTVDEAVWSVCTASDACVAETRARGDGEVISVRIFGGVTQLRLDVERLASGDRAAVRAGTNLARDGTAWDAAFAELARTLFPSPLPADTVEGLTREAVAPAQSPSVLPWVAFGASAVALGIGAGFGISSRSARSTIEGEHHSAAEIDVLQERLHDHGLIANISFAVSLACAAAGVTWFVLD